MQNAQFDVTQNSVITKSCGVELSVSWLIQDSTGQNFYAQTVESDVKDIVVKLNSANPSLGLAYWPISNDERNEFDWTDLWCLELRSATKSFYLYCNNRSRLEEFAAILTKAKFELVEAWISKYARIRFLYEDGKVTKSWDESPYTNVSQEDWF